MPDSALTTFLVHLVVDGPTRERWKVKKNRAALLDEFEVTGEAKQAMLSDSKNLVRKQIKNQQTSEPVADALALLKFAIESGASTPSRKTGRSKKKR